MSSCSSDSSEFALALQAAGAAVATLGIVFTVAGLVGLKYHGETGQVKQCTKRWQWWVAAAAWCAGQVMQLLAVKVASEPVVASTTTLAVPVNAIMAWHFLGEPLTKWDWLSIAVMLLGAGLVVFTSPQPASDSMNIYEEGALFTASPSPLLGLLATAAVAAVACFAVWRERQRGGTAASAGFGLLAGVSGACSITTAKLCWLLYNETLKPGGDNAFAHPASWLIGGISALGEVGMVVALYYGLRRGEATVVVPTFYIAMTVLGALQGLLLFDMIGCFSPASGTAFVVGVLLACSAVALTAGGRRPHERMSTECSTAGRATPLMPEGSSEGAYMG